MPRLEVLAYQRVSMALGCAGRASPVEPARFWPKL